jgi:hypothetical protein
MSSEIKVDTISEQTSANGVAIDSVILKDGAVDVQGVSDGIILDADGDTTISADTDDQIDIKIAGADDFQFTANTFTAQSGSTITTPTLGVGNTKDLGAGIHIKTADSSVSAVSTAADDLVIEQGSSGNGAGLSILSATDDTCNIFFGDSGDNDIAFIQYNHANNEMTFATSATEALRLGANIDLSTGGEDAPDVSEGGLCLDQNAADTQILSLKSSDVAHGMTSFFETDTMLSMSKIQSANGGVAINTAGESVFSTMFQCLFISDGTATSTSATGPFMVRSFKRNSSNTTAKDGVLNNDQNIFIASNQSGAKFIVKADGDIYYDGADQGAYDSYDDAMLVRSWDLSHNKNVIDSKFDEFVKYNHEDLANAELVGREEDGTPNHFVSLTGMQRLHNGAIWQQYEKTERLANAMYELAKAAVGEDKANEILEQNEIKLLN